MNAPSRTETFVLADGESKLTVDEDTKIPNAATITINKEDHTLANMLRAQLLLLPSVLFAGYKVPHPLEARVVLKVQTDGQITPIQAVQTATQQLILVLSKMKQQFNSEVVKVTTLGLGQEDGGYGNMDGLEGSQFYSGGL